MTKFWEIDKGRHKQVPSDSECMEYLLGGLSAKRRTAIEQSAIVDDKVSDLLRAAEEALVQGYVESALPSDVRKRFESLLEASVSWQRKVRFAKALLSIAPQVQPATVEASTFVPALDALVESGRFAAEPRDFGRFKTLLQSISYKAAPLQVENQVVFEQLTSIARKYLSVEKHSGYDATALVNEAVLRLASTLPPVALQNEASFITAMAQAIRGVLVDRARSGGGERESSLSKGSEKEKFNQNILRVDIALRDLETRIPRASQALELVFFGGLSVDAAAQVLGVSPRTVRRDLNFGKAFIHSVMKDVKT